MEVESLRWSVGEREREMGRRKRVGLIIWFFFFLSFFFFYFFRESEAARVTRCVVRGRDWE